MSVRGLDMPPQRIDVILRLVECALIELVVRLREIAHQGAR